MNEKVKFTPLNKEGWEQAYLKAWEQVDECYRDDPMVLTAEVEAEERSLKRAWELIENPEAREQASKRSREELARQAKILEQGRIPTVYDDDYVGDDGDYDDDDYDADEWYLDDECYPDDE